MFIEIRISGLNLTSTILIDFCQIELRIDIPFLTFRSVAGHGIASVSIENRKYSKMSTLKDFFNVCLIFCRSKVCDARIKSLPCVPAAQFLFRNSRTDFKCSHASGFGSQIGNAAECSIHTDKKIIHRLSSRFEILGNIYC